MSQCADCGGSGNCPWCNGTGEIDGKPCEDCDDGACECCHGTGEVADE
jgi:hypothetical protein